MLQKFAEDLKNLRKSKGLSLTEISALTKISQGSFQKIENGDFTFQPETYIRAFIKQYGIALDIDPDELIKDYDLARAGKYTPKYSSQEKIDAETTANVSEEAPTPQEKRKDLPLKEVKSSPVEKSAEKEVIQKKPDEKKPAGENKQENKQEKKQDKTADDKYPYNYASGGKNGGSPGFDSSILKTLGTIIVVLLICVGLYFLIDALFLNSKKDKVEVQRQNFDEVVKENEKTILGKRSEEEIQDSIRKAEEEHRRMLESMSQDTLKLVINSLRSGTLTIVADSVNISKPERVEFGRNEIGEWQAKKFFIISSSNTAAFIAKVNGKVVEFPDKIADRVKIGKDGIIK